MPEHCAWSAAGRAAWTAALTRLLPPAGAKLLDIAAGTGFLSLAAARLGCEVTALDISAGMLHRLNAAAAEEGLSIHRLRRLAPEHHAPYPAGLRDALPMIGDCPPALWSQLPSQPVGMPKLSRLRDVDWARLLALPPLDRLVGVTPNMRSSRTLRVSSTPERSWHHSPAADGDCVTSSQTLRVDGRH